MTDAHLWASASYYSALARGPWELLYFYAFITLGGGFTILWSLRDGEAGNLMFDGGSICKRISTANELQLIPLQSCMGLRWRSTCTPSCQVRYAYLDFISDPDSSLDLQENFISLPDFTTSFPSSLRTPTLELASSHLVCSVALTGVLALQAGRWWAENNTDE